MAARVGKDVYPDENGIVRPEPRPRKKWPDGVSVFNKKGIERCYGRGGVFMIVTIPESLKITRNGVDPNHFVVVPAQPMKIDDYQRELNDIKLIMVDPR
jgi:hypothetical protein